MPENEPKAEPRQHSSGPNNYLKFTGLAFQMIAIIGGFTYIGYRIDKAEQPPNAMGNRYAGAYWRIYFFLYCI